MIKQCGWTTNYNQPEFGHANQIICESNGNEIWREKRLFEVIECGGEQPRKEARDR